MLKGVGRSRSPRKFLLVGVTFLALLGRPAWAQAPCPPTATVEGPDRIVADVNALLTRHGVRTTADQACPGRLVRAQLAPLADQTGYTLTIVDDAGRTSARIVGNPSTAASLIESWLLEEDAMLLTTLQVETARTTVPPRAAEPPPVVQIYGGPETSVGSDGSWWLAFSAGACARWGQLCLGARLRATRDSDLFGPTQTDLVLRTGLDLLATASWTFRGEAFALVPTVGVGPSFMRTITEGGLREDAIVVDDRGPRGELSLLAGRRLTRRLFLAGELGGSWAPWAHTAHRLVQDAVIYGEPAFHLRLGVLLLALL